MTEVLIGLGTALWLGILTSMSPCPLATNIAAVSFLAAKIGHPKSVFFAGLAYTLGRMVLYVVLGALIIGSLLSVPVTAVFLQKYLNKALGPVLIFVGLFLLDIIRVNIPRFSISGKRQIALFGSGLGGAFLLGVLFALSFCPVSAALFFGSLIPLALNSKAGVMLAFIYGLGTALPVMIFVAAISLGVASINLWFNRAKMLERYTRKITGVVFILAGIYFIRVYIIPVF